MCMTATHRAVAAAVGIVETACIDAPLPVKALLFGVTVYMGAWPDLDSPGSKPSRELGPVSAFMSAVVQFVAYMVQAFTGDLTATRQPNGVHRGLSHTAEWCALTGALVWYGVDCIGPLAPWSMWFGVAVFSGAFSHVVLGDIFTPSGVPLSLLWNLCTPGSPWRRHRIDIGVTTDHPSEHLVFMLAVRVAVIEASAWAVGVPITAMAVIAAAVVGAGWHWLVLSGVARKVLA